jgi:hypothetical protein
MTRKQPPSNPPDRVQPEQEAEAERLARLTAAFDRTAYHPERLALMRLARHASALPDGTQQKRRLGLLGGLFGVVCAAAAVLLLVRPGAGAPEVEIPLSDVDAAGLLDEAFPDEETLDAPLGPLDDGLAAQDLEALADEELEALALAYEETLGDSP